MDNEIIKSEPEFLAYCDEIKEQRVLAISIAATGEDPRLDQLRILSIAWENFAISIDCRKLLPGGRSLLKSVLESSGVKIFHEAGRALQFLVAAEIFPKVLFDTALAARLLLIDKLKDFSFGTLSDYYLREEFCETLSFENQDNKLSLEEINHCRARAKLLLRLRKAQISELKAKALTQTAKIEFDCAIATAQMEYHGVFLDLASWHKLSEKYVREKDAAINELYKFSGTPAVQTALWGEDFAVDVNFESNDYVLSLLRKYEIPAKSTSKQALAPYREHPLVKAISRYRTSSKLLSSFLYPLPEAIHKASGRLHPHYEQIAAWSGRMSCYAPNIQQIPRNKEFRSCFAAPEGRVLLLADYSQIELRVVAQITKDERMLKAYRSGEDLHSHTASIILNKPIELISSAERQYAKAVNFGLIYAMGAEGLRLSAQQSYGVEMSYEQAQEFRKRFFAAYPAVKSWHNALERTKNFAGQTLAGRKFSFTKWHGLPVHSNAPVQGSAADILKRALGNLAIKLSETSAFIVATIHDEIIVECPEKEAERYKTLLKTVMEEAADSILKDVPTGVDVTVAKRWSEK